MEQRVIDGIASQDVVEMRLRRLARERRDSIRVHGVATAGQHANDLELTYAGKRIFVEVKGIRQRTSDLILLERSVRRDKVHPDVEKCAIIMARNVDVGGARLEGVLRKLNREVNFIGMLDFFRDLIDPSVGLSEDKNAPASGKMPKELLSTSRIATAAIRKIIVGKLRDEGNSYLAVHDKSADEVFLYHTGLGDNPIGADPIPAFDRVKIDTYGGSSKGATRVAIKSAMKLS